MPLSTLYQLDPTSAASNSNYAGADIAENCAPSGVNNALRALGQMVTQQLCYKSAAISASVSTNLATASTGLFLAVKGTSTINSFGTVPGEQPSAAVLRIVQFSSSASLVHSSDLLLLGQADRRTQPSDIGIYIHDGNTARWRELAYNRFDGSQLAPSISATTLTAGSISASAVSAVNLRASGALSAASASVTSIAFTTLQATSISASVGAFGILKIAGSEISTAVAQVVTDTSVTYQSITTDLPVDNSAPGSAEGDEVLSASITPTNASSTIEITVTALVGASSAGNVGMSLLQGTSAINATACRIEGATSAQVLKITHVVSAGSTSARTYSVRVGPDAGGPVTAFVNGDGGSRYFGGVATATLVIKEILP
jgi:hypothetical protein